MMTLIPGLRRSLEAVPEVLDTPDYTDRLARLGGINYQPTYLGRIAATTYTVLWVAIAVISPVCMTILRLLGQDAPLASSDQYNEFLAMTAWMMWAMHFAVTGLAFMMFQLLTVFWYVRNRRWRVRLGQSRIAMHLALTPAGGWFLAATVARSWQRHMKRFLLPPLVLSGSLILAMGVGILNEQLIVEILDSAERIRIAGAVALLVVLHLLGYVLQGLVAFSFIGSPTSRNWLLLLILVFSSMPGMVAAAQQDRFFVQFLFQLLLVGISWGLVFKHLRHAGADYSRKILMGREAQASSV